MADIEVVAHHVVDAAVKLHIRLGPGLLESVYRTVLAAELRKRGLSVETEKIVSFDFDGIHFENGLRLDLLVEECLIVELKSVERLAPVHSKQVLTYLRLTKLELGLLLNFGSATMAEGLKRVINTPEPFAS